MAGGRWRRDVGKNRRGAEERTWLRFKRGLGLVGGSGGAGGKRRRGEGAASMVGVAWSSGVLAASPRRVQLNLLRDLSADDLAEALADGIKETSSAEQVAAVKPQTDQLLSIMRSVGQAKTGDVVTMDFIGGETRIAFNGQPKGSIAGEPFNAALMRIWLADKPVQADLRRAMLGN